MEQNTNFKVGDIVHMFWSGGRPIRNPSNPNQRQAMSVKILRITPKRFLVEEAYPPCVESETSDEEGEAKSPRPPYRAFVKNVYHMP